MKIYALCCAFACLLLANACSKESSSDANNNNGNNSGTGGSMARFTIVGNYLYSVDNTTLHIYNISNPSQPIAVGDVAIGMGIETIFPYHDQLFIGSMSGMFIYDLSNPSQPANPVSFAHARACDPVVANDSLAFITLRNQFSTSSDTPCGTAVDGGLYVVDISDTDNPELINYQYFAEAYGLGYDSTTLFVCDGSQGLSVWDYTNPRQLQPIAQISGFTTYDVIPENGIAIVVGPNELRQYNYTNRDSIYLLSTLKYVP